MDKEQQEGVSEREERGSTRLQQPAKEVSTLARSVPVYRPASLSFSSRVFLVQRPEADRQPGHRPREAGGRGGDLSRRRETQTRRAKTGRGVGEGGGGGVRTTMAEKRDEDQETRLVEKQTTTPTTRPVTATTSKRTAVGHEESQEARNEPNLQIVKQVEEKEEEDCPPRYHRRSSSPPRRLFLVPSSNCLLLPVLPPRARIANSRKIHTESAGGCLDTSSLPMRKEFVSCGLEDTARLLLPRDFSPSEGKGLRSFRLPCLSKASVHFLFQPTLP